MQELSIILFILAGFLVGRWTKKTQQVNLYPEVKRNTDGSMMHVTISPDCTFSTSIAEDSFVCDAACPSVKTEGSDTCNNCVGIPIWQSSD